MLIGMISFDNFPPQRKVKRSKNTYKVGDLLLLFTSLRKRFVRFTSINYRY